MTTSTHLRQVASRTGLDSIAEAIREGANTIEQHEATIARRDAVIKLLEGEVAQAHEARKQAQAQLEQYKAALTKAEHEVEQLRPGAERYSLLRRGQHWSVVNGIGDVLRAEELDAAIDAARKATP